MGGFVKVDNVFGKKSWYQGGVHKWRVGLEKLGSDYETNFEKNSTLLCESGGVKNRGFHVSDEIFIPTSEFLPSFPRI